jgi:hypothetical protein
MAHDTHHEKKEKKVYFAPAVIMGLSFWLFAFFFLSLCNKKEHHEAEGHESSHQAHISVGENHEHSNDHNAVEDSMEVEVVSGETGDSYVEKIPFPINNIKVLLKSNDKLLQSEYSKSQLKTINEITFIDSTNFSIKKTDLIYECKGLGIYGKIKDKIHVAESFSNKLTDEMKYILSNSDMNSKIIIEAMLIDENGNKFKISKKYTVKN